ncbi:MAG: type VI secretion system contractile sheath protein TssC [Bacteroidetes bacterium 4484_249]|nr:MAG: type VI secretion system contractile sheath protein TssC [Bacteroidetes bacterium 4484_249]
MEDKKQEQNKEQYKEKAAIDLSTISNPAELLEQSTEKLEKFGGFDLVENTIDGVQKLNPKKKATKKIFLSESQFKAQREKLKKSLEIWADLLSKEASISDYVEQCETESKSAAKALKENLKKAIEATKDLERSYRSVALFYKNTENDKVKYVSLMNASPDQLKDLDNPRFIDAVSAELDKHFDRLSLKNNYSIMVVPGYLGSKAVLDKWGKFAHKNKVLMVTDFRNLEDVESTMEMFEEESLNGGDAHLANVIMACNWLVGREKFSEVGEDEELFVPPSSALAGKLYNTEGTPISQGSAGKKYGTLNEVSGARFDLKKSEIAGLNDLNLIPMVFEDNRVMAFSNKTLFNGNNVGLQEYPIVRVFDWIGKVLMNFFNDVAFQKFDKRLNEDIWTQIVEFLGDFKGKLFEDFTFKRDGIKQDPITKDISIEINIKPFFAAKNFYIKLEGHDGKEGREWEQDVT